MNLNLIEFVQRLFESTFMPHGHCYLWRPGLLWLHVGSDALIAGAYFTIPVLMVWFLKKRKDLAFKWMFGLFGLFIFLCGATHLMRIVTVWHGVYWFEGGIKLLTGGVSVATAVLLVPLVPKALQLPTPTELRKANEALEEEIEQRKEAERELAEAYEKLKETERLKDEFFANVSHELRTPLTLILSPVESMLGDEVEGAELEGTDRETEDRDEAASGDSPATERLPPEHRTKLQTVHNNSIRMLQMVNGLLDFSRLEIGEVEVDREPTRIDELTHTVVQDFGPLSERKDIALGFESTVDSPVVEMDRYLYERILFNLLSNAIKFTPSDGEVWVRLSQEDERLELSVADTGEGIPEAELETIFKDFRQIDASSTRRFEGTGLGLPLVKEFTDLLEGDVSVETTPGVGSTFTVTLRAPAAHREDPRSEQPRQHGLTERYAPEQRPSNGDAEGSGTGETSPEDAHDGAVRQEEALSDVVLAEDNEELSIYIKELLLDTCQVHVATDGEEALELVQALQPELVITDIMMPKKDGLALCRELKRQSATADIPVVMLTALTNRKALLRGWEAGADEYLFKPFHPKELVTRIRTLLRNIERRKAAETRQKKLQHELLRTSVRERRRIGQNLHDGLASHMTGVSMMTQSLLGEGTSANDDTIAVNAASLERIVELAQEGARQARSMARGLNPVKLDDEGLPAALRTLTETQEAQFDVACTFEQEGSLPQLPEDATINLYWIAHEAVHNAVKHGEADRIVVRLSGEGTQARLEVVDDGTGLPAVPEEVEEGMGLATMRYRAELIGAQLDIRNREKRGVRVTSTLSADKSTTSEESPA